MKRCLGGAMVSGLLCLQFLGSKAFISPPPGLCYPSSPADTVAGSGATTTTLRRQLVRRSVFLKPRSASKEQASPQLAMQEAILKDLVLVRKTAEYGRGASTVLNYLAFVKKATLPLAGKGISLGQVVDVLASTLPEGPKKNALLEAYRLEMKQKATATLSKFSGGVAHNAAMVGPNYMLATSSLQVSSGKSVVVDGAKVGSSEPVKVKLGRDGASMKREWANWSRLRQAGGSKTQNSVIQVLDFLENYDGKGGYALVMEAGADDLARYIIKYGKLSTADVRRLGKMVLDVLSGLESAGLVWTDLRAQNFVLFDQGKRVKAIDLESAVPQGSQPVDCSPEVTPPEISMLYANGQLGQAVATPAYDMWSLGVLLYTMATGKDFLSGQPDLSAQAMQRSAMRTPSYRLTPALIEERVRQDVQDQALAGILLRLLRLDPRERPTIGALRREWFFARPF